MIGSPHTLAFAASKHAFPPERLAAEVLRALRNDVQSQLGFAPSRAVIGAPALRRAREDAAEGLAGEDRLVFELVYAPLTSYVVRLVNVRSQRVMARAVMLYLHALAQVTSDGRVKTWRARVQAAFWAVWILAGPPLYWRLIERHYQGGTWTLTLLLVGFGCVVAGLGQLANLWVDVWIEDDELVVQNKRGRHVICHGDVGTVRTTRSGMLWVRLTRKAPWVPRWLLSAGGESLAREFERRGQV